MQRVQELKKQGVLALPLGMNLLANYSTSTISLKFIAPLGNQYIAAASLATSTYWMFGKLLVQSLCGALDTRASQVGACLPVFSPDSRPAAVMETSRYSTRASKTKLPLSACTAFSAL